MTLILMLTRRHDSKRQVIAFGLAAIFLWGIGGLTAKLAQNEIGLQILLWGVVTDLFYIPLYLASIGALWPLKLDPVGIGLALLTGLSGAAGLVFYYLLLAVEPASLIVPLTALYPAVTAVLGIWLLRESLTRSRTIGIGLALAALYFLSR